MGYRFTGDFNERCTRSVGDDIVYEVAEDAIDKAGVSGYNDLLGHLQAWRDPFLLECEGRIIENTANNLYYIHILVFLTIAEVIGLHLVEPCERTHVEQLLLQLAAQLGLALLMQTQAAFAAAHIEAVAKVPRSE